MVEAGYAGMPAWKRALELYDEIVRIAALLPDDAGYWFVEDLTRTALRIPSRIARGHRRLLRGEFSRNIAAARGSLARLETLLYFAQRCHGLTEHDLQRAHDLCDEIRELLPEQRDPDDW
jgi:four helix bundle protein